MALLGPVFTLENKLQAAALGAIGGVDSSDVSRRLPRTSRPGVIYTYGLSPFSTEAVALLEAKGAKFEVKELGPEWFLLGPPRPSAELAAMTGQSSLPHVFIGGATGRPRDGPRHRDARRGRRALRLSRARARPRARRSAAAGCSHPALVCVVSPRGRPARPAASRVW